MADAIAGTIPIQAQTFSEEIQDGQKLREMAEAIRDFLTIDRKGKTPPFTPSTPAGPGLEAPRLDANTDNLALVLMDLRDKIGQVQIRQSKEDIKLNLAKNKETRAKRIEKIQKFLDKMKASKKSGLFGKIFGWVAASAMLVAAVAATVATGGAAAPLLAAAIFNMTIMVLEETGHMEKLQKWLADKMGSDIGATLLITGVIIAVNIAAMGAGGGLNVAANMQKATTTAQKVAIMVQAGSEMAAGAALVGQGAATTVSAKEANEAAKAQADSAELQKFLKKVQALMEEEMDRLEEVIQQLEDGMSAVMDMMRGNDETYSLIARQMA